MQPSPTKRLIALLSRAAPTGLVTPDLASSVWGGSARQASQRLGDLVKRGWLVRVRRGLYAILPLDAQHESQTTAGDPWLLAQALYNPCYIAGWSAAEHWQLTEQIFRSTFVATAANIRHRAEEHFGAAFRLARVKEERLHDLQTIWRSGHKISISGRERTIVDAAINPAWVGGVRQLAAILNEYRQQPGSNAQVLAIELEMNGNGAAAKRLGYLCERYWADAVGVIATACELLSTGYVKLDPSSPHRGKLETKWGLWVNVRNKELDAAGLDRRA